MNDIYFKGYRSELKPFIPQDCQRILEIGCGEGGFHTNFPEGVEYWGVEPNKAAHAISKDKLHKVLNGIYDDVAHELPDGYFDLIVCNDVIEHMIDHDAFFEQIKSKMTTDGQLLMSIPNVRFLPNLIHLMFGKDWQYQDEGILDRTHLRFFTKKSLIRTLNEHNFCIHTLESINIIPNTLRTIFPKIIMKLLGHDDTLCLQFACVVKLK